MKILLLPGFAWLAILSFPATLAAAPKNAPIKAWIDPQVADQECPDFGIQGEYLSQAGDEAQGVQVVAQGKGTFIAKLYAGGLPGQGWAPGQAVKSLSGQRIGGDVVLHDPCGCLEVRIRDGEMRVIGEDEVVLKRVERSSPTLGATSPDNAQVLFDGSSAEEWAGGKLIGGKHLAAGCTSKRQFSSYRLHLEFRTPFMPDAKGQKRGNSGVYHSGRWETQILDSFGLPEKDNHCGGIYSISKPALNMGLPPLAWQTYDVEFTAAAFDAAGKRIAWPRITVRLNGVLIHEDLELNKEFTTAAPIRTPLENPFGPIYLQDHNNPVAYRNIWVVPG